jgi:hypothetical protein
MLEHFDLSIWPLQEVIVFQVVFSGRPELLARLNTPCGKDHKQQGSRLSI